MLFSLFDKSIDEGDNTLSIAKFYSTKTLKRLILITMGASIVLCIFQLLSGASLLKIIVIVLMQFTLVVIYWSFSPSCTCPPDFENR